MPIRSTGDFGDLHVKLLVNLPKKLSDKQRLLIDKIFPEPAQ
jgi:DnaJ-class molecular chaperone